MTFTIKSRRLGHDVDFHCSFGRYGEGYVRINMSGKPTNQATRYVKVAVSSGSTLMATEQSLKAIVVNGGEVLKHTRPVEY